MYIQDNIDIGNKSGKHSFGPTFQWHAYQIMGISDNSKYHVDNLSVGHKI